MSQSEVLADFPQMDYKAVVRPILRQYPRARFILNVRDPAAWVQSVKNHNDMRARLTRADLPGLPPGTGHEDAELIDWLRRHWAAVERFFECEGARERLLSFDIDQDSEAAKAQLEGFLGRQGVRWGKTNMSPRRKRKARRSDE